MGWDVTAIPQVAEQGRGQVGPRLQRSPLDQRKQGRREEVMAEVEVKDRGLDLGGAPGGERNGVETHSRQPGQQLAVD